MGRPRVRLNPPDSPLEAPHLRAAGELERWLNWALGVDGSELPRIPLRRVNDGGWSGVVRTLEGRRWADEWWEGAFAAVDLDR